MPRTNPIRTKSILSFLFSKLVMIAMLILLQLILLITMLTFLGDHFNSFNRILRLLSLCIVIWLVPKEENPSYKLAWVILIMTAPVFGGLFYLLFGNKKIPMSLTVAIRNAEQKALPTDHLEQSVHNRAQLMAVHPHLERMARYLEHTTMAPLCRGTHAVYFSLGEDLWTRMCTELEAAKQFIFLEYFILQEGEMWEPILDTLTRKAGEGLDVRVLYDDLGSIQTLPPGFAERIRARGIHCAAFNPFRPHLNSMMNYRDHRKITVIDGNVGFCGGINIADEYINRRERYGHWKDTGVMLEGDGVRTLTTMFLTLWNLTCPTDDRYDQFAPTRSAADDGFVQAFGDSPLDRVNVSEDIYMQMIDRSCRYIYMTTPYLILDNEMVVTLQTAARSGVDVRIVVPGIPDKWFVHQTSQSFYQVLLNAGVRIFEYKPGFVHSKMYVSDDRVAVVGTANMDYRSFYLHFECGVCFFDSTVVQDVRDDILRTIALCSEIPADYNRHVILPKRILRAFLRLFSPMM